MPKGNAPKDPVTGLTPLREKFVQNIFAGQSFTDAYKNSYGAGNMSAPTIHRRASELMANSRIKARLEALQAPAKAAVVAAGMITLEGHLAKLAELRDASVTVGQMGAAITAEVSRGRAVGYYIERRENGNPGEFQALDALRKADAVLAIQQELDRRARLGIGLGDVEDVEAK